MWFLWFFEGRTKEGRMIRVGVVMMGREVLGKEYEMTGKATSSSLSHSPGTSTVLYCTVL